VTFKRIMLVVLPLLAAIFVFMVLRWAYHDWEASFDAVRTPLPDGSSAKIPAGVERMKVQSMEHVESESINLMRKDRDGRPEMRFMADRLIHKSPTTADIDLPRIQLFTRVGEIITLLADHATIVTKGPMTNLNNIESGVLWGNVIMVHDRGTPDDRSDDILAEMTDLRFNGEMSELSTDGPVVMSGIDMLLTASKMRMAIDRKTRRINTMTFVEDIRITMATGDRVSIGLPTPTGPAPAAPPSAAPRTAPTPTDAGASAPAAAQALDESGELWQIDLRGDVDARQAEQRLQCKRLVLYNRPGKSATPGQPEARPVTPVADVAGAAPATAVAPPRAKRASSTGSRAREGSAAAKVLRPDAPPPLVVMAYGPLIITPVTSEDRKVLGDAMHMVVATGAPVVVDDAQTRVVGSEVRYNIKTGSGSVIGKESPMLMEQPGRLRLTGGRLDFDRSVRPDHPFATADVQGEGQLFAQTQGMSFSGKPKKPAGEASATPPGAAPAAVVPPEPPTPLEATWTRAMHLEFYQLPTDSSAGMGEIRRAAFSGQAVVKQTDGTMKGDELAIDFSKSQPGRGQAVDRLVGHGDVFIRNKPPEAAPAPAPAAGQEPAKSSSSKIAVGDIACQDLDMVFERDAAGDTQPHELKAKGAVEINDPSGKIRAEDLVVKFAPAAKGGGVDPQFFEAFGNVLVDREDLHAEGDHVRRDLASGMLLLEGKPARAARGASRVVGPRIEFNQTEGTAVVRGAGELEMPSTTDLRGRQSRQAEPMLIKWKNSMLFVDKRNFAQFDGAASATTGTSRLSAERIWVYFAGQPADATAQAVSGAPAATAAAQPRTKNSKSKDAAAKSGGEMDQLFGRKTLVRLFAEKDAHAIDQQWNPDKTLRFTMEMIGDNLTYVDESRKAYIRGPGRLRILAREKPRPGEPETQGLLPDAVAGIWQGRVPDGYSRTEVAWVESMAYDGATDRAYFKGEVETIYTGRSTPGGGAQAGAASAVRIESGDLQAVFGEKPAPTAVTLAAAPGAAQPPQPAQPVQPDVLREERMAVEKLVADGGVRLWVDDRRGTGERLIYQRVPEEIRLYRGMDDWARMWQENEASQEFGEIVARVIAFEPATGRVNVVEQQSIVLSPKPRANPSAKSAPKPMFKP
jgi:lipopolysaccharide export system protein LptA